MCQEKVTGSDALGRPGRVNLSRESQSGLVDRLLAVTHRQSLNVHPEVGSCLVTDAQRMGQPVGILCSRGSNRLAQSRTGKVITRDRFDRDKLITVRLLKRLTQAFLIDASRRDRDRL